MVGISYGKISNRKNGIGKRKKFIVENNTFYIFIYLGTTPPVTLHDESRKVLTSWNRADDPCNGRFSEINSRGTHLPESTTLAETVSSSSRGSTRRTSLTDCTTYFSTEGGGLVLLRLPGRLQVLRDTPTGSGGDSDETASLRRGWPKTKEVKGGCQQLRFLCGSI